MQKNHQQLSNLKIYSDQHYTNSLQQQSIVIIATMQIITAECIMTVCCCFFILSSIQCSHEKNNLSVILEWTTSLDTSSRTLFVSDGGRMSVHVTSNVELRNYVRLFLNVKLRNYVISRQIVI